MTLFLTWTFLFNIFIIILITYKILIIKIICFFLLVFFSLLFYQKIFYKKSKIKIISFFLILITILIHVIFIENYQKKETIFSSKQNLKVVKTHKNHFLVKNKEKEFFILTKNYYYKGIQKKLLLDLNDAIDGFFITKTNYLKISKKTSLIKNKKIIWLDQTKKWTIKKANDLRTKIKNYLQKINTQKTISWINFLLFQKIDEKNYHNKKILNNLGITHLFVISGFHLFVIYKLINLKNNKKQKHFFSFFIKIIALILCFLLTYLTNWKISTLKSFIFFIIIFLFKKMNVNIKNKQELTSLIAICFLIFDPTTITKNEFILSVLGSWTILFLQKKQKQKDKYSFLTITFLWLKKNIYIFFVILPLLINLNYQISIFAPLLSSLFALFIVIFYPLFFLLIWFEFLQNFWNDFFVVFEQTINLLEKNIPKIIFGTWKEIYVGWYYLKILILLFIFLKTENKIKKNIYYLIFLISLTILSFFNWYQPYYKLHMINVNHGLAMLLQSPNGKTNILFDSGINRQKVNNDDRILRFLHKNYVKNIDALFISHNDADHYNNVSYLKKNLLIKRIITNKKQKKTYKILDWHFSNLGSSYYQKMKTENNRSLVLKFKIKKWNILLTFDAEKKAQEMMIKEKKITKIDFLQIPHHGSFNSIDWNFFQQTNPSYCLISDNRTHLKTENVLKQNQCKLLKTINGNITITFKEKIEIERS